MKKFALSFSLFVFLVGIPAFGQQIGGPPVLQPRKFISVEDDTTGNYISFSPTTGDYKFYRCGDGLVMSGKGLVKIQGCSIALEDVQETHRVLVSVDQCEQIGKASIERIPAFTGPLDAPAISESLSDKNMRDSSLSCTKR